MEQQRFLALRNLESTLPQSQTVLVIDAIHKELFHKWAACADHIRREETA
jgi:hypothetical protein